MSTEYRFFGYASFISRIFSSRYFILPFFPPVKHFSIDIIIQGINFPESLFSCTKISLLITLPNVKCQWFSLHLIFLADYYPKNKSSRRSSSLEQNFPGKIFSLYLIFQGKDYPIIFSPWVFFPPNCQVKTNIPKIRLHKELDYFLPFHRKRKDVRIISSNFLCMVKMVQGQFSPISEKWSKWSKDNFLPFSKSDLNKVGAIYTQFLKMVSME